MKPLKTKLIAEDLKYSDKTSTNSCYICMRLHKKSATAELLHVLSGQRSNHLKNIYFKIYVDNSNTFKMTPTSPL